MSETIINPVDVREQFEEMVTASLGGVATNEVTPFGVNDLMTPFTEAHQAQAASQLEMVTSTTVDNHGQHADR